MESFLLVLSQHKGSVPSLPFNFRLSPVTLHYLKILCQFNWLRKIEIFKELEDQLAFITKRLSSA